MVLLDVTFFHVYCLAKKLQVALTIFPCNTPSCNLLVFIKLHKKLNRFLIAETNRSVAQTKICVNWLFNLQQFVDKREVAVKIDSVTAP